MVCIWHALNPNLIPLHITGKSAQIPPRSLFSDMIFSLQGVCVLHGQSV